MRIGVFCSGGDAPGMNPCVRAVVRTALVAGHEVIGIRSGYQGLLDEDFYVNPQGKAQMSLRSVSNIQQAGGTILQTSRSQQFRTEEGLGRAAEILKRHRIDALVPIGGDGTFRGAVELARHWKGRVVGCPGTIDNDLVGTDFTIGFHTAVATAVDAVDKLRDTAESHERLFLVEVMGRHSGFLALYTALAGGAEIVCLPETPTRVDGILEQLNVLKDRQKQSVMIVVAEGDEWGGADELHAKLDAAKCPYPSRAVVLGHLQRGGTPVPADRLLGNRLGKFAVDAIGEGANGQMAGEIGGSLVLTPFDETFARHKPIPAELFSLLDTMAH